MLKVRAAAGLVIMVNRDDVSGRSCEESSSWF